MSGPLERLIEAVLYEGFILYPYRPSAKKNRQRFSFGLIYPESYSIAEKGRERCAIQTECLLTPPSTGELGVSVRFLHPILREVAVLSESVSARAFTEMSLPRYEVVPELWVGDKLYHTWQEASERRISLPPIALGKAEQKTVTQFSFERAQSVEPLRDGNKEVRAVLLRRQEAIRGVVELTVRPLDEDLARLRVRVLNDTPLAAHDLSESASVLLRTMASCHTILQARGAQFCSLLDPAPEHQAAAAECVNLGTWPALVGDERMRQRDTMLSSPIILYDYPTIAPESPGSFFDATEIDEMLTLRVQTLTEEEKAEVRASGEDARRLLERTESLSGAEQLRMHGTRRTPVQEPHDFFTASQRLTEVNIAGGAVRVGGRVRLKPAGRADIFDIALRGKVAEVEGIEEDFEGRVHLAVVLENDPGKDLGMLRQPGHRFFFGLDEVELFEAEEAEPLRKESNHG